MYLRNLANEVLSKAPADSVSWTGKSPICATLFNGFISSDFSAASPVVLLFKADFEGLERGFAALDRWVSG
jgi:hypothetical protein